MRLVRRMKIRFNTQMHFKTASLKPAAPAFCQMWRFYNLRNTENTLIKRPGFSLPIGRHGQLYVIDPFNLHQPEMPCSNSAVCFAESTATMPMVL